MRKTQVNQNTWVFFSRNGNLHPLGESPEGIGLREVPRQGNACISICRCTRTHKPGAAYKYDNELS